MSDGPIVLFVVGDPAPKGSGRAMITKSGAAVHVPSGSSTNAKKLGSWKTAVTDAWGEGDAHPAPFLTGPVAVGIIFRFPLRKGDIGKIGAPKAKAPVFVTVKPDVDKLVRSTFDALTHAGAWTDDSQVSVVMASKVYVPPGNPTGATIIIGTSPDVVCDLFVSVNKDIAIAMGKARGSR